MPGESCKAGGRLASSSLFLRKMPEENQRKKPSRYDRFRSENSGASGATIPGPLAQAAPTPYSDAIFIYFLVVFIFASRCRRPRSGRHGARALGNGHWTLTRPAVDLRLNASGKLASGSFAVGIIVVKQIFYFSCTYQRNNCGLVCVVYAEEPHNPPPTRPYTAQFGRALLYSARPPAFFYGHLKRRCYYSAYFAT